MGEMLAKLVDIGSVCTGFIDHSGRTKVKVVFFKSDKGNKEVRCLAVLNRQVKVLFEEDKNIAHVSCLGCTAHQSFDKEVQI